MNKTPRLTNTGIEYLDKVWNFLSGCTNGCSYCWARPITERFPEHYPDGFKPHIYPDALLSPLHLKKPSIIGCCFMGDLFEDEVDPNMPIEIEGHLPATLKAIVYDVIRARPEHAFLFLTKQPQNLIKWSPFPENCWVGVSATNPQMFVTALNWLDELEAKVKYISFEPLLESIPVNGETMRMAGISWVILGSQTKPTVMPKIEWVSEIVEACDKAGIAVCLKDNLEPLLSSDVRNANSVFYDQTEPMSPILRQEQPK